MLFCYVTLSSLYGCQEKSQNVTFCIVTLVAWFNQASLLLTMRRERVLAWPCLSQASLNPHHEDDIDAAIQTLQKTRSCSLVLFHFTLLISLVAVPSDDSLSRHCYSYKQEGMNTQVPCVLVNSSLVTRLRREKNLWETVTYIHRHPHFFQGQKNTGIIRKKKN